MNLALDRFSRSLHQEALRHLNTCRDCNKIIPECVDYCAECAHFNWSEEIAGLNLADFSKKLADLFDGELRDFDILDGQVEFTYYSKNQQRLITARQMLELHGASYIYVDEGSITFRLVIRTHHFRSEMEIE